MPLASELRGIVDKLRKHTGKYCSAMITTELLNTLTMSVPEQADTRTSQKKRILILDDNSFFSKCLAALIDHETDLTVCHISNSYTQLLNDLVEARPQLLLMDVCIGTDNGIQIAQRLRSMQVKVPILLTSSVAEPTLQEMDAIGHCGFVSKFQKPTEFLAQIRNFLH